MKMRNPRVYAVASCAAVGLIFSLAIAPPADAQTLQAELEGLTRSNPQILAAQDAVTQAVAAVRKAASGNLPKVTAQTDATYRHIDGPSQRAEENIWSRTGKSASVNLTQNLFDGGQTSATLKGAQALQAARELDLEATRQQVFQQGANAYIDVVRFATLVELAAKAEDVVAEALNLEDEKVERGGGTAVDVLQAKTRLQIAKDRAVTLQAQLVDAENRYRQIFGHAPARRQMVDPLLSLSAVPNSLDRAISNALDRNPVLLASQFRLVATNTQQDVARAGYQPSLQAIAGYNWQVDREGDLGTQRDYRIGVQGTWNIFNGFATQASVTDAAAGYSAAVNNRAQIGRKVEEETRLAWSSVHASCARRKLQESAVILADELLDARVKLRDTGRETVANVIDALNNLSNAEINLVNLVYDEKQALNRLAVVLGQNILEINSGSFQPGPSSATPYARECAWNGLAALLDGAPIELAPPAPAQNPFLQPNPFQAVPPAAGGAPAAAPR